MKTGAKTFESEDGKLKMFQITVYGNFGEEVWTTVSAKNNRITLSIEDDGYPIEHNGSILLDVENIILLRDALTRVIDEQAARDE